LQKGGRHSGVSSGNRGGKEKSRVLTNHLSSKLTNNRADGKDFGGGGGGGDMIREETVGNQRLPIRKKPAHHSKPWEGLVRLGGSTWGGKEAGSIQGCC